MIPRLSVATICTPTAFFQLRLGQADDAQEVCGSVTTALPLDESLNVLLYDSQSSNKTQNPPPPKNNAKFDKILEMVHVLEY
jgi:hypothetical protein